MQDPIFFTLQGIIDTERTPRDKVGRVRQTEQSVVSTRAVEFDQHQVTRSEIVQGYFYLNRMYQASSEVAAWVVMFQEDLS